MSFQQAIRTCLQVKYADFSGRARRSEFWFFALFGLIVNVVTSLLDSVLGLPKFNGSGLLSIVAGLALLVPGIAVAVRRLHDTGRSGWLYLLVIIPVIGWIVLLVFYVLDSTPGTNKFGPSPKEPAGTLGYGQSQPPAYGAPGGYGTPPTYGSTEPPTYGTPEPPSYGTPPPPPQH